MKKPITIGIVLMFLTAISLGCVSVGNASNTETQQKSLSEDLTSSNEDAYETTAIALNENGGRLLFYLLRGINSGMVSVYTLNAELTAYSGTIINESDFKTGQLVNITYDGMILESYPGQIPSCSSIQIIGDAEEDEVANALVEYQGIHTSERIIYHVDHSGMLVGIAIPVMYGDLFGEWKKANNVPDEVRLLEIFLEDNAYTEIVGEVVQHTLATIVDYHLDLSEEFLYYLASTADEKVVVSSLVKTMIGDDPFPEDTGIFITVKSSPLMTELNDFGGRLIFDM